MSEDTKVTSLDEFKKRQADVKADAMKVNQIVTPIHQWEIQLCANESNAFQTLAMFEREEEAIKFMNMARIRLVQKATLSYEDNEKNL